MDAQAGLHLCCSQTPEDRFSHIEAHIFTEMFLAFFFLYILPDPLSSIIGRCTLFPMSSYVFLAELEKCHFFYGN